MATPVRARMTLAIRAPNQLARLSGAYDFSFPSFHDLLLFIIIYNFLYNIYLM